MFRSAVTRSSSASQTASQMRALACGAREGGGAWRTTAAPDAKAASSETRCGLGSGVRYSASRETSGRRRRTSRRRAENRTLEAAAKERPSGKANSASGLWPEAGWRTRSWSRRMKAPRASRILSATRHLRATAASPWPEDAARSRSVSADASAAAERRDPPPKARSASRWCADGGAVDGKRIRRRFPSQGIHEVVAGRAQLPATEEGHRERRPQRGSTASMTTERPRGRLCLRVCISHGDEEDNHGKHELRWWNLEFIGQVHSVTRMDRGRVLGGLN